VPLALLAILVVAIGVYVAGRSSTFLSEFNLNSLLLSALPLALVAMGQTSALLVGGFDISVGAVVTICVVVASSTMRSGLQVWELVLGSLAVLGIGVLVGFCNAALVRIVKLPSIIATLATLSVLQGIALALRPVPAGDIDLDVMDALVAGRSFVPYAFVGVLVVAAAADLWLYRTPGGLSARAVGLDETSSRRLGARAELVSWRAFVAASIAAAVAAFFVAAQAGVGDATVGSSYTLESIAAAVLGGAALAGGKGSFVGAVFGAVFLSLIVNILPLLGWSDWIGQVAIGALTLLALVLYQGDVLVARARGAWGDVRRLLPARA
jgi:ribose transport system ATP-binding protein